MSDRERAGGWLSPEETQMSMSPSLGRFVVSLFEVVVAWEASCISCRDVDSPGQGFCQQYLLQQGQGLTGSRQQACRSPLSGCRILKSLLRFLLFQQLLFLLCGAGQVETIAFPVENPLLRGSYQDETESEVS